jgi:phenylacetate-CoA ligase
MSSLVHLYYKLPYPVRCLAVTINGYHLNYQRKKSRVKYITQGKEIETYSSSQVKEWQSVKLQEILRHVSDTVPFYKDYWAARIKTEHGVNIYSLVNWPIITKDIIRENPLRFISQNYSLRKLIKKNSSGTTGKPMTYYIDRDSYSHWYALYDLRIKQWNGVSGNDRWANIGGQLVVPQSTVKPPFWVWNAAMNQLYMSSYHLKSELIQQYVNALKKYRITYLLGYVSSLYNLAYLAKEEGIGLPALKLVITNAEPLLSHQRSFMHETYQCPVIQTYSGNEFAFGGNEALNGSLYLWPEAGIVEVVDENNNFVSPYVGGELVATGLINPAMPLIRFKVGDSIKLRKPVRETSEKLNFEIIEEISGRTDDLVRSTDGRMVGRLDPVFKTDLKIKEAQIIQHSLQDIEILIVAAMGFSETDSMNIISRTKDRVGGDMNVYITLVKAIPRGPNGKFRAVESRIKVG